VLWLEDLADGDGGGWAVERFGLVARGLGRLGGAYAGGRPVPDWPWLSQGFLASWVEQAAAGFEVFAEAVRDPLLARLYPPEVAAIMSGCGRPADACVPFLLAGRRCSVTWTRCRRT